MNIYKKVNIKETGVATHNDHIRNTIRQFRFMCPLFWGNFTRNVVIIDCMRLIDSIRLINSIRSVNSVCSMAIFWHLGSLKNPYQNESCRLHLNLITISLLICSHMKVLNSLYLKLLDTNTMTWLLLIS